MSSGFPTKRVSNQSSQLQRLAKNSNFTFCKFTSDTLQIANNKGADQTVRKSRLVWACVVRKPLKAGFLEAHMC